MERNKISGGVYLVIDPSMNRTMLLKKLEEALSADISVVQIWDNWQGIINKDEAIREICNLCHQYQVPVIINNDWKLLNSFPLDGVHFDVIPEDYDQIKQSIERDFLAGITCNNDLSVIEWADRNQLSYISFCSIFPSLTSSSCELVSFKNIQRARQITSLPIFLAGGIQLNNMQELQELNYDGVAIISGIMGAENPALVAKQYLTLLKNKNNETRNYQ
ncbi:thiamine phosphate synthase [Albibacterium bauzanense]|nr:thiamine phosphate synthase [Albibacterium bauzanense]